MIALRSPLVLALVTVAGTLGGACGGTSATTPDATEDCTGNPTADTFVVGLSKPGTAGQLTFKLMQSTPAPPGRGDNTWDLQVLQGATPVTGATVSITPFMPSHQHGGVPLHAVVTEMGDPGHYQAAKVNMWMPGIWESTVEATPAGGTKDTAVFRFCIPG